MFYLATQIEHVQEVKTTIHTMLMHNNWKNEGYCDLHL